MALPYATEAKVRNLVSSFGSKLYKHVRITNDATPGYFVVYSSQKEKTKSFKEFLTCGTTCEFYNDGDVYELPSSFLQLSFVELGTNGNGLIFYANSGVPVEWYSDVEVLDILEEQVIEL